MAELLTMTKLADQLGVSRQAVRNSLYRHRGLILTSYRTVKTRGGPQRCLVVDMASYVKSNRPIIYEDMVYYLLTQVAHRIGTDIERQFKLGIRRYDFRMGNLLIEYDGESHRRSHQRRIDAEKDELAKQHGYDIIRIVKSRELLDLHQLLQASKAL